MHTLAKAAFAALIAVTAQPIITASTTPAFAAEQMVGKLKLGTPVLRATLPGQKVAGGYLTIMNMGDVPDRLIGGSAPFAGKVEIHEMKMEGGVMKMNAIPGGLALPTGTMERLKPGGNHVMFMQLKEDLKEGDTHPVELEFEKAGTVTVTFTVKSIGDTMKMKDGEGHSDHSGH
ncbi:MAG: copper chaperone PCu(A)C [Pseudomonadota bacterium]